MPFSQAMTFSGSPTPAARRAAMPLAMAGAMKGRMRSPTGRGDDLGAHDLVDDLPAARIDTRNITDPHVAALHVHDMHGVGAVFVDAVDDLHVHIGENHMVPRLGEYRTDESAADIARAELNSSFHIVLQKD